MDTFSNKHTGPLGSSANLTSNADLTLKARELLKGQWNFGALVSLVYIVVAVAVTRIPIIGHFSWLIQTGPFSLGLAILFLCLARKGKPKLEQLFEGFTRFKVAFTANLLTGIFFVLWSVLLIIPGIMAGYSYAMTYFILADEPNLSALDAIRKSKQFMLGHRWKLFYLGMRFFPWALLCVLTLGIGALWLIPYLYTSVALFYEDIKRSRDHAAQTIE